MLVQGIDLTVIKAPLHQVFLRSGIFQGMLNWHFGHNYQLKMCHSFLGMIWQVTVFCLPEVINTPVASDVDVLCEEFPDVFGTCVVTRSQACKFRDTVDLSDYILCADNFNRVKKGEDTVVVEVCALPNVDLLIGKPMLIEAQRTDLTLSHCIKSAVELPDLSEHPVAYYFKGDVLMRKWSLRHANSDWSSVFQVIVLKPYRQQVLSVAHDHEISGHLGIRKTYDQLLKHFFWPSMKSDVAKFCKSCHACQIAGKPNRIPPPALLKPIPVLGEPFERILIDCVTPCRQEFNCLYRSPGAS